VATKTTKTRTRETVGKTWRKPREEGHLIQLPSGNCARLRAVGLDLMVKLGRIPDAMASVALDALEGRGDGTQQLKDLAEGAQMIEFVESVCELAFVSPKIVKDPQADDEIHINDVDMGDKWFVLGFLNRPARELERFRQKQHRDVAPVGPEPEHVETTE